MYETLVEKLWLLILVRLRMQGKCSRMQGNVHKSIVYKGVTLVTPHTEAFFSN